MLLLTKLQRNNKSLHRIFSDHTITDIYLGQCIVDFGSEKIGLFLDLKE